MSAEKLESDAIKRLNSWSPFGLGKSAKIEDAAELFKQSAVQYKLARQFAKCAEMHARAADCRAQIDDHFDAAKHWEEGGKFAAKDGDYAAAERMFSKAIETHKLRNRLQSAAKLEMALGELLRDNDHPEAAIAAFQRCADLAEMEDKTVQQHKAMLAIAHLSAQVGDYSTAVQQFDAVARASLDNRLAAHSCTEYFFKAMCCRLCQDETCSDIDSLTESLERYADMYPPFENTREHRLLSQLLSVYVKQDLDAWATACYEFEQIVPLRDFEGVLLLKAKKQLGSIDPIAAMEAQANEDVIDAAAHAGVELEEGIGDEFPEVDLR
ncbi:MAG: hypothetical protein MHM6MM_002340 [Cercozoa sp. M6MM]